MKVTEILSIISLGFVGLCVLLFVVKSCMKNSMKEKMDKIYCFLIFVAVSILGVIQLINETEPYTENKVPSYNKKPCDSKITLGSFNDGKKIQCNVSGSCENTCDIQNFTSPSGVINMDLLDCEKKSSSSNGPLVVNVENGDNFTAPVNGRTVLYCASGNGFGSNSDGTYFCNKPKK